MNHLIQTLSFFSFAFILLFSSSACDEVECNFAEDQKIIEDYLSANNITATKRETGLHYVVNGGIGTLYPTITSQVTVRYKGYFTDGTVFDENQTGVRFPVNGVIPGWQEGLTLMKKESTAQFFIPSSLAYGVQPVAGIAGRECSVLVFDVEMVDFQ